VSLKKTYKFKNIFSSLKVRLYLLLLLAVIFPIVLITSFTVTKIYDLYKYNANLIINNELNHLKQNMETAYQGMLYISQQLLLDENIKYDLPRYWIIQISVQGLI